MSASRVYSWISSITERNVKQVTLSLDPVKPLFIPMSLFTCESLIKLELSASGDGTINLPKSFSLPKLKSLTLCGIKFTDDSSWNEQQFSNCPVLEQLTLDYCTWFGVRNFCISIPALKLLDIDYDCIYDVDGLLDCVLKIDAPNLVSLTYRGNAAKEYVLSSFQTLESARVLLYGYNEPVSEQKMVYYGAAVSKFIRALSHVQCLTIENLEVISFVNILPMFHNLDNLKLEATTESVFPLLRAAPNLTCLVFENSFICDNEEEENIWAGFMLTERCLFQHLQSVSFLYFHGTVKEMRWLKLILKNAKALKKVTMGCRYSHMNSKTKEYLVSEFPSLPKASDGCVLEFH